MYNTQRRLSLELFFLPSFLSPSHSLCHSLCYFYLASLRPFLSVSPMLFVLFVFSCYFLVVNVPFHRFIIWLVCTMNWKFLRIAHVLRFFFRRVSWFLLEIVCICDFDGVLYVLLAFYIMYLLCIAFVHHQDVIDARIFAFIPHWVSLLVNIEWGPPIWWTQTHKYTTTPKQENNGEKEHVVKWRIK